MPFYEYKWAFCPAVYDVERMVNKLGAAGWRLVDRGDVYSVFERELPERVEWLPSKEAEHTYDRSFWATLKRTFGWGA